MAQAFRRARAKRELSYYTVEARQLEYDRPLIPKQKKEETAAQLAPHLYSNLLESTVNRGFIGVSSGP